jgi:hypothetical protein
MGSTLRIFTSGPVGALAAIVVVLVVSAPTSAGVVASSPTYQTFLPPFHSARTSEVGFRHASGSNVDTQSINTSGNYTDSQNSSVNGNGRAAQSTYGWFYSSTYNLTAHTALIHVNSSGIGGGMAKIAVGCRGPGGSASAVFVYSLGVGLWDRTTSRWVGTVTFQVYALNLTTRCLGGVGATSATKNLTTGWSIGLNPNATGVSSTDKLQIVTVLLVATEAHARLVGWAYAYAQIGITLQRMQGYYH